MPREKIKGLLSQLHEKFADSETSSQQEALMQQLQSQLSDWEGPKPADGSVVTTAEMLLEEVEEKHPQLSMLLKEILEALGNIGI